MKRIYLTLGLCCTAFCVNAQNDQIQNKKGVDIMPQKGDFAIGVNALPALLYIGDLFGSGEPNTALGGNKFVSPFAANTLFGKYMLTDNTAIRAHLRIGVSNNSFKNSLDDAGQTDPDFRVSDAFTRSSAVYNIGAGYEWRRGKTRLRGIYGGEVFYQFRQGVKQEFSYGNPIQIGSETPFSTTWNSNGSVVSESSLATRVLSTKAGNSNSIGLRAFAGIEYFIAPKICVGTEFGWGGAYTFTGESSSKVEFWNNLEAYRQERTLTEPGSNGLSIDTDNFNGAIYLMFYF